MACWLITAWQAAYSVGLRVLVWGDLITWIALKSIRSPFRGRSCAGPSLLKNFAPWRTLGASWGWTHLLDRARQRGLFTCRVPGALWLFGCDSHAYGSVVVCDSQHRCAGQQLSTDPGAAWTAFAPSVCAAGVSRKWQRHFPGPSAAQLALAVNALLAGP